VCEFRDRFGRGVQAFFDDPSRGIRTSAVTLRPRPLDGVDGGGLFVGTEVAREGDERGGCLGFDDAADGPVAMVAMFIPIASLVS